MVVLTDLKLVGTLSVRNFLTDFADFNYRANPYVEEINSDYIKITIYKIGKKCVSIFTHYNVYEDGTEKEEMVHWGLDDVKTNMEKTTFYVHYEDWNALYCYLSMLDDEYDIKEVKCEIRDDELIINKEFIIKLYK